MEIIILIITGLIGGLIAGMLGLGGGVFYVLVLPIIMVWQGIPAEYASPFVVANSLFGIVFASGSSLFSHRKQVKIYFKESIIIGTATVIISLLATKLVVHSDWFSKEFFNVFVILLMVFILLKMQLQKRKTINKTTINQNIPWKKGVSGGALTGFISALSGLGGGVIIIPYLQIRLNQSVQKAKLISLAIIVMSSAFISIQNLLSTPSYSITQIQSIGYILPSIALPLVVGVVIGGPLGVKLSKKLDDQVLNNLFSTFVIIVLIEKLVSLLW